MRSLDIKLISAVLIVIAWAALLYFPPAAGAADLISTLKWAFGGLGIIGVHQYAKSPQQGGASAPTFRPTSDQSSSTTLPTEGNQP